MDNSLSMNIRLIRKFIGLCGFLLIMVAQASRKEPKMEAPKGAETRMLLLSTLGRRESGKKSDLDEIKKLQGTRVKIPGFMVPLTPDKKDPTSTIDFLLVPGLQSCIHVPPPPPSQTVYVKMKPGEKAKMTWDPLWIEGTIKVLDKPTKENPDAMYVLDGISTSALSEKDRKEVYETMLKDQASRFDCAGRDKLEPVCQAQRKPAPKNLGI